jgi:1-acyl-sn-glycerol-3-phosphate acyltransferase
LLRRAITAVLRFALRLFFRRIEVVGRSRVPRDGACLFVLNHPNALIDPAFLLAYAPRRVSFLAKSPLFRMPVIGFFVRALDSIPVYRKQDEGEGASSRNRETFERSAELLTRGGTIAICPEGASHSEPYLLPLKTGAARIALGAASAMGKVVYVVPAGLYYTAKTSFRSGALLYFGEPIPVETAAEDEHGEPARERVRELSDRIADSLRSLTLNADQHEALAMVGRAERIFSSDEDEGVSLERELRRRRRFVEGYAYHRARSPERLEVLEARIHQYEEALTQAGFEDPRQLTAATVSEYARAWTILSRVALFLLLSPAALAGVALHYPAYKLAGLLATKFARQYDDVLSTFKIAAALLLFPVTWCVLSLLLYRLAGWWGVLTALVCGPITGYLALRTREEFDRFRAGTRAALFFLRERSFFRSLLEERRRIRREILALGDEAERAGAFGEV